MNKETQSFILAHLHDDVHELALKKAPNDIDMPLALRQIEARQIIEKKVPSWYNNDDLLFPPHISMEQGSSETTALYKSQWFHGESFADLTGGLGVDTHFFAQHFTHTDYVEQNPDLCKLAQHNFQVLQQKVTVHNTTTESFLSQNTNSCWDLLYLDPARRDNYGHKLVSITDCSPNVVELQDELLRHTKHLLIKLSPMLDISKALSELHHVKEVHVVAVANECKELLFLLEPDYEGEVICTCVNLLSSQPALEFELLKESRSFIAGETPATPPTTDTINAYLYEPNVALMKAGCFAQIAERYQMSQIHKNSHLFTSENYHADFPGRAFQVIGWAPYSKKLKSTLLDNIDKASIAVRNFPLTVDELRKALKIKDGDEYYIFATTLRPDKKIMILTKKA